MKAVLLVVALSAISCGTLVGCNGATSQPVGQGEERKGHVDLGFSVELNFLFLKLKLWGVVREVDRIVVTAFDNASRQLVFLANGESRTVVLTQEQIEELRGD